jgi:DNA-binding winged helix-turn-helix (wHTH) protein
MTTVEQMAEIYAFGEFTLDVPAEQLRGPGGSIRISPRLFRLLLYLVENKGRMVPKEEILEHVWSQVHVSEGSLARAVASLRHLLGDPVDGARLLETVHWRGYRFIADVESRSRKLRQPTVFALVCGGRSYKLHSGKNVIGRDADCEIFLPFPSISRFHAKITVSGNHASIEDMGSTNGTFIDDQRLDGRVELSRSLTIRLGREAMQFLAANESTEECEVLGATWSGNEAGA